MKILCAAMSAPGHAYPMLAVAHALVERGHQVTFLSGWEHEPEAVRAGCRYVDFPPGIDGSPREALRFYEDAASMARAMLEPFRAIAPDIIVHDSVTLGPALVAEMLGVPLATLVVHLLPLPSRDLPPFGLGRRLIPLLERSVRRNIARDRAVAREQLDRARASLGLGPSGGVDGGMSEQLIVVATLPSLEPARTDWPQQARVVGPCPWEPSGTVPPLPEGDGPVVLLAPSTAHDQSAFVAAAVEAVRAGGLRALLTAGPTAIPAGLGDRIVAVASAPHGALLDHCDAVVTSGGHGIVVRALAKGVPLVIVPGPGDQRENAYRVAKAGAGVRIRRPHARRISRALRKVLRDAGVAEVVRRKAAEAASLDGPGTAATLIEAVRAPRDVRAER